MRHTLDLSITVENDEVVTVISEPESGLSREFSHPLSCDEHPEYNDDIGNEIYSWIALWAEEE